MSGIFNQVRIDQTRTEILSLSQSIKDWIDKRQAADIVGQHHTQLSVLKTVLTTALAKIETGLDAVSLTTPVQDLYATCRLLDRRVVWVRRVWDYYSSRFAQREDATLGKVLKAADEVVWSCYDEVFRNAKEQDDTLKRGTPPLPYIDLYYSPHAIPRAEPPPFLKSDVDAPFLQKFMQELPIPIVGLPAVCLRSPWCLVSVGHEVGHHVLYDLLPNFELQKTFGKLIRNAAYAASDKDSVVARRWEGWEKEIFADLFSILCMGHWALWAIAELEVADLPTMFKSTTLYPAPVVRLSLMAHMLKALGLESVPTLGGMSLAEIVAAGEEAEVEDNVREAVSFDLCVAPAVARAAVATPVGELGSLKSLCGWDNEDFKPGGVVMALAEDLRDLNAAANPTLRAARLYASSAVAAWVETTRDWDRKAADAEAAPDAEQRDEVRAELAEHVLKVIGNSRVDGTRSAEKRAPAAEAERLGIELGEMLLGLNPIVPGETIR